MSANTPAKNSETLSWRVEGMDCASCAAKIRSAVERMPGVSDAKLSVMSETLTLRLDAGQSAADDIERQITKLGYKATPLPEMTQQAPAAHAGSHALDHGKDHKAHVHGPDCDHDHSGLGGPAAGAAMAAAPNKAGADTGHGLLAHVHEETPAGVSWWQTGKGRLVIGTGALLAGAWLMKYIAPPQVSHWAFIIACMIGVIPVARRSFAALAAGIPFTIEMLMTIAAAGALVIGAAEEAALVVFLFAVGEVLEGVAAQKARASIKALGDLVPKTAWLESNGQLTEVTAASVNPGQIILARPGDRIAADGEIVEGASGIDESPVTGESVPKSKGPGEAVFAGSINKEAVLRIRVTSAAADNTISRIIRLVEEAQEAKAPTERFIDRFSRIYMPAIVGLALLVMFVPPLFFGGEWNTWIYRSLALLLIGCPCALVISVPASIASSLSAGARRGLLLKGGVVIEAAARTSVVAFDKTGTLTAGKPVVTDVVALGGVAENDMLALTSAIEAGSSHPLAEAILDAAKRRNLALPAASESKAHAGKGVEARVGDQRIFVGSPRAAAERTAFAPDLAEKISRLETGGKTVAAILRDDALIGLIAMRDEPRADAKAAVAELKAMGVRSLMLTGDNARTGAAIAQILGLEARGELMPDDKVTAIRELAAKESVMMIGDGINDAPALAAATTGIAMGSGTDVALETADGALLRNNVLDAPRLIRLARATMGNIRQNIAVALGLKAVFLVTSVLGLTGLWIAILADTGATVLVTLNALRLLGFNPDNRA